MSSSKNISKWMTSCCLSLPFRQFLPGTGYFIRTHKIVLRILWHDINNKFAYLSMNSNYSSWMHISLACQCSGLDTGKITKKGTFQHSSSGNQRKINYIFGDLCSLCSPKCLSHSNAIVYRWVYHHLCQERDLTVHIVADAASSTCSGWPTSPPWQPTLSKQGIFDPLHFYLVWPTAPSWSPHSIIAWWKDPFLLPVDHTLTAGALWLTHCSHLVSLLHQSQVKRPISAPGRPTMTAGALCLTHCSYLVSLLHQSQVKRPISASGRPHHDSGSSVVDPLLLPGRSPY